MIKALILALVIGLLAGCATTPRLSQAELDKGDYGTLTVDEANKGINEYLARTLIDPDSLRYRGPIEPQKYWAVDDDGKYHFGWIAPYAVNAKNQYGGYTGDQMYMAFFESKKIVAVYKRGQYGDWPSAIDTHRMSSLYSVK